jgi:LuxR family maltose regulon positive regulatory protein
VSRERCSAPGRNSRRGGNTTVPREEIDALGGALRARQPPVDAVERPALVARLDACARGALALVVAPAGWGKTTLVAQWARQHERVVWLPLHLARTPHELAAFFVGALGNLDSVAQFSAVATEKGLGVAFVDEMVERLGRVDECYIVLERVDRVAPASQEAIGTIIERSPPHIHFVATARADVMFPSVLPRLRVRDDVSYLRAGDLAFDRDAIRRLVAMTNSVSATTDTIEDLHTRTEGWPAALRLALAEAEAKETSDLHAVIAAFGAGTASLRDYCRAEILDELPPAARDFVLETSAMDVVTEDLCAAVTKRDDAGAMLDTVGRYALLLADARDMQSYRYRPLLRDVFRAELEERAPGRRRELLTVAAQWHAAQEREADLTKAARYFADAQRWADVVELARAQAMQLHARGRVRTVLQWLEMVPERVRYGDVGTALFEATLLTLLGDTMRADFATRQIAGFSLTPGEHASVLLLRSLWVLGHVSPSQSLEASERAELEISALTGVFDGGGLFTPEGARNVLTLTRACSHWYSNDVVAARRLLQRQIRGGATDPVSRVSTFGLLADIEARAGSLRLAEDYTRRARRVATDALTLHHPYLLTAELAHAFVLTRRGSYDQAHVALDRAETLAGGLDFEALWEEYTLDRAALALALGEPRRALSVLENGAPQTADRPLLDVARRVITARALLALDDISGAGEQIRDGETRVFAPLAGVAAQIALLKDDVVGARHIIDEWPRDATRLAVMEQALWRAIVNYTAGDTDAAIAGTNDFVSPVAYEDHRRVLLDAGPVARPLLTALARRDPNGFVASVLAGDSSALGPPASRPGEPTLSMRERTVLRSLADRLTYAEIADQLYISQNTVKTHAKAVYMKLGVSGRREAVERGRELGLI